jgi:hypothetical protein
MFAIISKYILYFLTPTWYKEYMEQEELQETNTNQTEKHTQTEDQDSTDEEEA